MTYNYETNLNFNDDWEGCTGGEVQNFIKHHLERIDGKVGYFYNVDGGNTISYLLGFEDKTDYDKWVERYYPEEIKGIDDTDYVKIKTPINKAKPNPYYTVSLQNLYTLDKYISLDGNVILPVKYIYNFTDYNASGDAIVNEQYGTGELIIEASSSNDLTNPDVKTTMDIESNVNTNVNLTSILNQDGNWKVRMKVYCEEREMESPWIMFNVIKTNISVTLTTDWSIAQGPDLKLHFNYSGSHVNKYLNIEVSGAGNTNDIDATKKTEYNIALSGDSGDKDYILSSSKYELYHIYAHGIHTVKYWVNIDKDDRYSTPPQYMRFMIVEDKNNTTPYIILNNVKGESKDNPLVNWSHQKLFDYAVYAPKSNGGYETDYPVELTFKNSAGNALLTINNKTNYKERYEVKTDLAIDDDSTNLWLYCTSGDNNLLADNYMLLNFSNEGDYAPSKGALFVLNPRIRSNQEDAANLEKVYNTAGGESKLVDTEWGVTTGEGNSAVTHGKVSFNNTDGWIADDNNSNCLRILSGQQVKLLYQPFFPASGVYNSYTIEATLAVRNITNPNVALLRICDERNINPDNADSNILNGFELRGNDGYFLFNKERTKANTDDNDIIFGEDEKFHLAICVNYKEKKKGEKVTGLISDDGQNTNKYSVTMPEDKNFVRIYINGVLNRIISFSDYDFPLDDEDGIIKRYITIGNIEKGGDIDIYELRVYQESEAKPYYDIIKDYCSSLSTIEEKDQLIERNRIITESETDNSVFRSAAIDYTVVKNKYNTLLWKPVSDETLIQSKPFVRPCGREFGDTEKTSNTYNVGDLEVNLVGHPEKSGKLTNMFAEGQGTTAMYYFKWNQRYKFDEIDGYPSQFISNTGETLNGCYKLNDTDPIIKRLDGKINWASSMQSHKMGSTALYNDCWRQVVKGNGLTSLTSKEAFDALDLGAMGALIGTGKYGDDGKEIKDTPNSEQAFKQACKFTGRGDGYGSCRVCVRQEPFMFFAQPTKTDTPIFYGFLTWGASKGDKPTFGYNKNFNKYFVMIEGSDNERSLIECKTPWDSKHCRQAYKSNGSVADPIYYPYNADKIDANKGHFEISMGEDTKEYVGDWWGDATNPCIKMFVDMVNFTYLHNPDIERFVGDYNALKTATGLDASKFYWITTANESQTPDHSKGQGVKAYDLFRYNTADGGEETWVPAGLWNEEGEYYERLNLLEQFPGTDINKVLDDKRNNYFITLRVNHFKNGYKNYQTHTYGYNTKYPNGISDFMHVDDLQFTVQFIKFLAGTDNWAKNTYIYNTGIKYKRNPDGTYMGGSQLYNGWDKFRFFQDDLDTIFEVDNYGAKTKPYWVEEHDYEVKEDGSKDPYWNSNRSGLYLLAEMAYAEEMKSTMNSILSTMNSLGGGSLNNCLEKYYQQKAQTYFPEMAYNEAAERTYIDGHYRGSLRADDRYSLFLSQCLGPQLLGEREWQKKRCIYMSSYAKYGDFAPGTEGSGMGFTPENKVELELTPYMWLYPSASEGNSAITYNGSFEESFGVKGRVPAGQTFKLSIGSATGSENSVVLKGPNYYSSFGNLARVNPLNNIFNISGERVSNILIKGESGTNKGIIFNPSGGFNVAAGAKVNNISKIEVTGNIQNNAKIFNLNEVNLSPLWRLNHVDLSSTNIKKVILPSNSNIEKLILPKSTETLILNNLNKLKSNNFELKGYSNLKVLDIRNVQAIDTLQLFRSCKSANAGLTDIKFENINWSGVTAEELQYLLNIQKSRLSLTGVITMASNAIISFDDKMQLLDRFSNIDSETNSLKINYTKYTLSNTDAVEVKGQTYIYEEGNYRFTLDYPSNSTGISANDFTDIKWSVSDDTFGHIGEKSGVFEFIDNQSIIDKENREIEITCEITRYINGVESIILKSKTIKLYQKKAEVGDYVYADGTYSSYEDYMGDKPIIGVCFMVDDSDDPATQKRLAVAVELAHPQTQQWGASQADYDSVEIEFGGDIAKLPNIERGTLNVGGGNSWEISSQKLNDIANKEGYDQSKSESTSEFNYGWRSDNGRSYGEHYTDMIIAQQNKAYDSTSEFYAPTLSNISQYGNEGFSNERDFLNSILGQVKNTTAALYFPAAYMARTYRPNVQGLNTDKFGYGCWSLPSIGELYHIYYYISKKTTPTGNKKLDAFKLLNTDTNKVVPSGTWVWSSSESSNVCACCLEFSYSQITQVGDATSKPYGTGGRYGFKSHGSDTSGSVGLCYVLPIVSF